jgi:putative CocE/NonD family hydrolase
MPDGIRLAIDVSLPKDLPSGVRIPAVLYQTRYWRYPEIRFPFNLFVSAGTVQGLLGRMREAVVARGYAWIDVDVRGSGASFGNRPWDYAPAEIQDGSDVANWIVRQPWSNGRVATAGSSYTGSTAEFALVNRNPVIQATLNLSSEYDQYTDILFPGGIQLSFYLDGWGATTKALDQNRVPDPSWQEKLAVGGVAPVDRDQGKTLLAQAVRDHGANYDFRELKRFTFRDDFLLDLGDSARQETRTDAYRWLAAKFGPDFRSLGIDLASQHSYRDDIIASGVPYYGIAGWFDGTYANAMIRRFKTFHRPGVRLLIGPWDHHQFSVSPFTGGGPTRFDLLGEILKFLDGTVGGIPAALEPDRPVHYYTLGAEVWRAADTWPPAAEVTGFYFAPQGGLTAVPPSAKADSDSYRVDYSAGTGRDSRWDTVNGRVLRTPYPDRREQDRKLLVYSTEPLAQDCEVTGHPIAHLVVSSTAVDGAFFVYLEDVWPDGRVTYVTEGELRALHRKNRPEQALYWTPGPYHTFRRADAVPLVPGESVELAFELLPTSYLFQRGHRIRVAVAGADRDHFTPIPADRTGPPTIHVFRDGRRASRVDLPIVDRPR